MSVKYAVDTKHPDYIANFCRWELVRKIVNNNAKDLIRKPDPNDDERNKQYREDAILTNFTNLTCLGLSSLVFSKEYTLSLPPQLEYLKENVTGSGITLSQFLQHTVLEVLKVGRFGILVDYNNAGKAYLKPYCAESIINWKTVEIDGECYLSLITLLEEIPVVSDDPFCQDTEKQYRVLRLGADGYYQQIYNEGMDLVSEIEITESNGLPLQRIPFFFIGSENNDWWVDYQPMYDLAVVNLGHYRNSADYEESIFISGQPYPHVDIGEQSGEEFKTSNPKGILYGSRAGIITQKGKVELVQANPNQLVAQAMKEKLEQAAKIGARLIEAVGGRETAEAAKIRYGAQHSALYTLSYNTGAGVEDALEVLCEFMGANPDDVELVLNKDFYEATADPNLIAQQILMLEKGVMTVEEVREYGKKTGFIAENKSNLPDGTILKPSNPEDETNV